MAMVEMARGKRVHIRKLVREDVDKMQSWAEHEDPLFFYYNFPKMDAKESEKWYRMKMRPFIRKSYVIESEYEEIIGYLSIRDIKWLKRESELGIVLDPAHINKGYGTEAIRIFLDYYFNDLRMSLLKLRTAKFNKRAIRCYLRCGFKIVKEVEEEFEDQYAEIFYNPLYDDLMKLFTIKKGRKMTRYLHMRVTKNEFEKFINRLSTKNM